MCKDESGGPPSRVDVSCPAKHLSACAGCAGTLAIGEATAPHGTRQGKIWAQDWAPVVCQGPGARCKARGCRPR
jgi:hypothetical protein